MQLEDRLPRGSQGPRPPGSHPLNEMVPQFFFGQDGPILLLVINGAMLKPPIP